MARLCRDGQFDQMVVRLVSQIGALAEIDPDPTAPGQEDVQQFLPLICIETAASEQGLSAQNVFVLRIQRSPHDRTRQAFDAMTDDLGRRAFTQARTYEDVGIYHHSHRWMVSKMPPIDPGRRCAKVNCGAITLEEQKILIGRTLA
jgi:hypothetical protein